MIKNFSSYFRAIATLALPILIAQSAQTGMGVVDAAMVGHLGTYELAAVALGGALYMPCVLFLSGVSQGLVPWVSSTPTSHASKELPEIFHSGVLVILSIAIPFLILLSSAEWLFDPLDVESAIRPHAEAYLHLMALTLIPAGLHLIMSAYCQARSDVIPTMVTAVIGLLANIPLNAVFVYGFGPIPSLGALGCGIATFIAESLMAGLLAYHIIRHPKHRHFKLWRTFPKKWLQKSLQLFKTGTPIGVAIFAESSIFLAVALLIAPLGAIEMAAHQVALSASSMIFMVPLSLGMATMIRISQSIADVQLDHTYGYIKTGLTLNFVIPLCSTMLIVTGAPFIVRLYTSDPNVIALGTSLLYLAGFYQISDGLQVMFASILRGLKDTGVVMLMTLFAYFAVALPVGFYLGRLTEAPLGALGFWIGIVIGLTVAAALLGFRFVKGHKSLVQYAINNRT